MLVSLIRLWFGFTEVEKEVFLAINRASDAGMDPIFLALTQFGGELFWLVLGVLLLATRKPVLAASGFTVLFAILTTDVALAGLKLLFGMPRPEDLLAGGIRLPYGGEEGSGYPSGHTTRVLAGMGIVLPKRLKHAFPCLLVAGLTGYSRVYLGVHMPFDVLGGAFLGMFVGGVARMASGIVFKIRNSPRSESSKKSFGRRHV